MDKHRKSRILARMGLAEESMAAYVDVEVKSWSQGTYSQMWEDYKNWIKVTGMPDSVTGSLLNDPLIRFSRLYYDRCDELRQVRDRREFRAACLFSLATIVLPAIYWVLKVLESM